MSTTPSRPGHMLAGPEIRQQIQFVRLDNGTPLAWARHGRGPALLRVGQWLTHVRDDPVSPIWRPWLQRLGRELTLLRYDERGCGLSGADETPPGLEASVEELCAVVQATGLAPVALLGISGSAPAAVAFAARYPQQVSRLVLLSGYTHGLMHRNPTPAVVAYQEAVATLFELGWGKADAPVQQFFAVQMLPDATPEQALALVEQQRLCCDGKRAAALLRARTWVDVRAECAQVRCPTLVLHAEGDGMVPLAMGQALAAAVPGARLVTLATRNHVPLPGEPAFEQFCDAVGAFLRQRPDADDKAAALTTRERNLLALVACGLDNHQIAAQLALSQKTVRNAVSRLYRTLGVEGRAQAMVRARDLGY